VAKLDAIFDVDTFRGGRAPCGGPLWCHWDLLRDWAPDNLRQIVGHTASKTPVSAAQGRVLNLDTHLHHAALVYPNGNVEYLDLPDKVIDPKTLISQAEDYNKLYA
jgi:hypothetical protein